MQHELKLDTQRGVADGIRTTFSTLMGEALAQAKRAVQSPEDAVHQYRRALNRAEALILISWDGLRGEARRRIAFNLLRARRKTRFLRDSSAVVACLDALALEGEALEAAWALKAWLRSHADDELGEMAAWRLRKNARALAGLGDIFEVGLRSRTSWDQLLYATAEQYGAARRLLKRAKRKDTLESIHDFRKAARMLRYQLELLSSSPEGKALKAEHKKVKRLVGQLGEISDLAAAQALVGLASEDAVGVSFEPLKKAIASTLKEKIGQAFETSEEVYAVKASQWLLSFETKAEDEDDEAKSPASKPALQRAKGAETKAPSKESTMSPSTQATSTKTSSAKGSTKATKATSAKAPAASKDDATTKAASAKTSAKAAKAKSSDESVKTTKTTSSNAASASTSTSTTSKANAAKSTSTTKAAKSSQAASSVSRVKASAAAPKEGAEASKPDTAKAASKRRPADKTTPQAASEGSSTVVAGPKARVAAKASADTPDTPEVPQATEAPTIVAGPEAREAAKS